MSSLSVSTLSLVRSMTANLQAEQSTLSTLANQLATQKRYTDLTDYDATEARKLIDLQSSATQKQAYIAVISTISTTLTIYDTTLTDLESLAHQAQTISNNNQNFDPEIATNIGVQATNFLKSAQVDLNQQLNGRYIYSGSRYTTPPVGDLEALPESTLSTTIFSDNQTLPSYDSEWADPSSTSVEAYATDKATVDAGYVIDYGITSNDPAVQELIAGLRYLQAAGNATDAATYKANMAQASSLLSSSMTHLQALHTLVANSMNAMVTEKEALKASITGLTNQVGDIQSVDVTQVSAEITVLEAILQASYSATGSILHMSIVQYL